MIDAPIVALAPVVALVSGATIGVARMQWLYNRRRLVRRAGSGLARIFPETPPKRSMQDILAGRIRVSLGGIDYELPVLSRADSRKWLETFDGRFARLAETLANAGNDTSTMLTALLNEQEAMYDLLLSYDTFGVLPSREEIDAVASDAEVLRATLEVWAAANPLAAIAAKGADRETSTPSPGPTTTRPGPTAGVATRSSN